MSQFQIFRESAPQDLRAVQYDGTPEAREFLIEQSQGQIIAVPGGEIWLNIQGDNDILIEPGDYVVVMDRGEGVLQVAAFEKAAFEACYTPVEASKEAT